MNKNAYSWVEGADYLKYKNGFHKIDDIKNVCSKEYVLSEKCNCELDNVEKLKDISQHVACESPINSDLWKSVQAPAPKNITEDQLIKYLRKMQRPQGFDSQNDAPLLYAASNFAKSNEKIRGEFVNTLAVLALEPENSEFVTNYVKKNNNLFKMKISLVPPFCQSESEKKKHLERANLIVQNVKARKLSSDYLIAIQPFLVQFSDKDKDKLIEEVADLDALILAELLGISNSTAYYAAENKINAYFGRPSKELFDTQYIRRDPGTILHFSNSPFEVNGVETKYNISGYYYSSQIDISSEFHIKMGDRKLVSKVKLETLSGGPADFIDTSDSPNYKELAKDKKLNGFVLVGSNMLKDKMPVDQIIHRYKKYYMDQGFVFTEPKNVSNAKKMLLDKISKGELDYLTKEAHMGGDVHSLISFADQGQITEGSYKNPKTGRVENITLFLPKEKYESGHAKIEDLKRDEFSEAFHNRKKVKGEKPFFYFNNACNGINNVVSELISVKDKAFVNIGANSFATDFNPTPWSPFRQILHGIRNEKSYTEIQTMMNESPTSKLDGSNKYILPNTKEYKMWVLDRIRTPKKESISIEENGRPYSFSAEVAH